MKNIAVKILAFSFLAVLFFPALGLGQEEGEEMAQLAGRVLDFEKKPIAQVEIQLKHRGRDKPSRQKRIRRGNLLSGDFFPGNIP